MTAQVTRCSRVLMALTVTAAFSLNAAMAEDFFAYPMEGQSDEQQGRDRYECHSWAVDQTGVDPTGSLDQEPGLLSSGTVTGGAARGALLGTLGGAIAGDTGKGAAIGAATGGLFGGMRKQGRRSARASDNSNYERAMATCMQARGYSIG